MKVIIVDVTRAADSFGRTHLEQINAAYTLIAKIVAEGQAEGVFRDDIDSRFASMTFYGAIEQLLSGWIFGLIPASDRDFDRPAGWSSGRSAKGSRSGKACPRVGERRQSGSVIGPASRRGRVL